MKIVLQPLLLFLVLIPFQLDAQTLTFRFTNPQLDCTELCYDIEAQSDMTGIGIDEFNMRMFIDNCQLAFLEFRNPAVNYYLDTGGNSLTGLPGSGAAEFGFTGEFIYAYDNFKRLGSETNETAIAPDWSYLFQTCFTASFSCLGSDIDFGTFVNSGNVDICPSLVFDHETDGSGFPNGSAGIEASYVGPNGEILVMEEVAIHTNWDYYAPDPSLGECASVCVLDIPNTISSSIFIDDSCKEAKLSWTTESEEKVDRYIIEKRYHVEQEWTQIGEVISEQCLSLCDNEFTDYHANKNFGKVYYRIKLKEVNGVEVILKTFSTDIICDGELHAALYPNPTIHYSTLEWSVESEELQYSINIIDLNGKLVQSYYDKRIFSKGMQRERLDLKVLAKGQYILRIETEEQSISLPFDKIE